MAFAEPVALVLLVAIPLVWVAHLVARTNFNPRQRRLQAIVRSVLLAALVLALARPILSMASSRHSVVYLADVSHSVSAEAIESAARRIDEFNAALRPQHWRLLAFGRTSTVLPDTQALRELAKPSASGTDPLDRRGTDLEAALEAARAELAPGHIPRLVLFTDGRATDGDTNGAVLRLTAADIPVSVQPLVARSLGDTWVDRIEIAEQPVAGASFPAVVVVNSQREATGMVELRADGKTVGRRPAVFSRGLTNVTMDVTLENAGAALLEAEISVSGDPLRPNNTLAVPLWASARSKVLYVEGAPASAHYLSRALTDSGFDVTVRPASGMPATADELDAWDTVILSDVSRTAIRDRSMAALSQWVESRGGGLLVAGGESVFGERGYRESPLERLTPVTFERKDEPEVALVLVLDRSWSMAGGSMELCKSAAQAAVDVLTDEQSIGILTFNDSFNWDVPLRNVGKNRDSIRRRISAIGPGGHTLIYPAVEQAYLALKDAKARAKHVILLSDGRSYPADYEELVKRMVAARITVSSVAVGPAADPELLGNIAKWGRGRTYAVSDARELPQIFVKEAKNAATPAFDEKPITPILKTPAFLAGVDLTRVPQLKGHTATVLKDTALEVITTDEEDPLLAFWPIGLGRVAVFASDVKDRWGANWVRWRGYGPFFTSVVRNIERRRAPPVALEVIPGPVRGTAQSFSLSLEARDPMGQYRDLLRPIVQVVTASGKTRDLSLRQVTAGRYEATVIADATEALTFTVQGTAAGITARRFLPDPVAEYRFRRADEPLLKSVASATGGAWLPGAGALPSAPESARTERRPIAPALILLALMCWFADLLLRRIRLFEPR